MEILRNDDSSPTDLKKILKVTALKPSLKNENRVNVFLNDQFAFSLDLSQIVDFGIKKGKILEPEEAEKLKKESEFGKLYQRALEWTISRPHSIKETEDYLKRCQKKRTLENRRRELNRTRPREDRQKWHLKTKILPEITPENSSRVLERLIARGHLDDEKFATFFVENRSTKKGISHRRLEQELLKKGIDQATITRALSLTARDEAEELKKLIAKKLKRYPDRQKLLNYLLRQGFSYELIKSTLEEFET